MTENWFTLQLNPYVIKDYKVRKIYTIWIDLKTKTKIEMSEIYYITNINIGEQKIFQIYKHIKARKWL